MPLLILAGLVVGVALLLRLAYGPGYLSIDGMWSLQWGSDLLHLRALAPTNGTTPHPLSNVAGAGAHLLGGRDADLVLLGASYLAAGLLVVATGVLAARLAGRVAGVAAAVIVATRPELLASTTAGMLDVWAAAFVVIAVAAALPDDDGDPHEPRLAMVMLLAAGLLRPEAWALAGAWWLWRVWTDRTPHLGQLAMAVAAPILWAALDAVFAGDPLFAIHQTESAAGALRQFRGLEGGFSADVERALRSIGNALAAPLLIAVVAAVGAGAWLLRTRAPATGDPDLAATRARHGSALVVVAIGGFAALIVLQAAGGTLVFPRFALVVAALAAALVAAIAVRVAGRLGVPAASIASVVVLLVVVPTAPALRDAHRDTATARAAFLPAREALRPGVPCLPVGTERTGIAIYVSRWTGVPLSAVVENLTDARSAPASYVDVQNEAAQALFRDERNLPGPLAPDARVLRTAGGWTVSTTCN